jgi:mannitol-1-phosphate 5-dehydrogenase
MRQHIFTGFGFGPIQGGLFASEAFQSGNFSRIVVAETDQELVNGVRANNGTYFVNVAKADRIEVLKVDDIELYNPNVDDDRGILLEALSESTEIATCLPSVSSYTEPDDSVVPLLGRGLRGSKAIATIIYAAENNNHAAEILQDAVTSESSGSLGHNVQFLNTVIGKMSRTVSSPAEIEKLKLTPVAPRINRAFLVEEFNRILVTRSMVNDFRPGIEVFIEKEDLLPFEEAKLYGHNAIHALLAYIGKVKGYKEMTQLKQDGEIMKVARSAFLQESGAALIEQYASLDEELFTKDGYEIYAEDLLERMTNRFLADTTERAGRDVVRKLAYNDRIFGTMTLALKNGIEPYNMAIGAVAGIAVLLDKAEENGLPLDLRFGPWYTLDEGKLAKILNWIWHDKGGKYAKELIKYVLLGGQRLQVLLKV